MYKLQGLLEVYEKSLKACLGIEFLELELNSNSIYKFRGKKLCLGVEF
jgi:hypothetical protein